MALDSEWLAEYKKDRYKAFCAVCKKYFSLGTMGEYALKSHAAGKAHEKNLSIVKQNTKIFVSDLSTPAPAAIMLPDTPSVTVASTTLQSPGPSQRTETSCISNHFVSNQWRIQDFSEGGCLRSGPIRKVGVGVGGAVHFRSDIRKVRGGGQSSSGPIPLFGTQKIRYRSL